MAAAPVVQIRALHAEGTCAGVWGLAGGGQTEPAWHWWWRGSGGKLVTLWGTE